MKKLIIILIAAIFAMPVFNGCKKGEDDPFLTFKSRSGRLAGEWELTDIKGTSTSVYGTTTTTSTTTYANGIKTYTSGTYTNDETYTLLITIDKDGTYTSVETEDGDIDEETGYWSWKDGKSAKEMIDIDGSIFKIQKLSSKELILVDNSSSKYTSGTSTSSDTDEYSMTFTKK